MNQLYITTVPLQTRFGLKQYAYSLPEGGKTAPTSFPIIPVLRKTVQPGDTCRVIALRQNNADTETNFRALAAELAESGVGADRIQSIVVEENQRADTLLMLCRSIVDAIPDRSCVHACITFGTKTFSVVTLCALQCAQQIRQEVEVGGVWYGEIRRHSDGTPDDPVLNNVDELYQLASLMGSIADPAAADELFHALTDQEEE